MRSIGTSYAGTCKFRGVSTALEVWEEHNLILIKYGGSIGEDSCGDCGSILFLGSSGSFALVQWPYILTIFCTVYPRLDCSVTLISVISSIKASRL